MTVKLVDVHIPSSFSVAKLLALKFLCVCALVILLGEKHSHDNSNFYSIVNVFL